MHITDFLHNRRRKHSNRIFVGVIPNNQRCFVNLERVDLDNSRYFRHCRWTDTHLDFVCKFSALLCNRR